MPVFFRLMPRSEEREHLKHITGFTRLLKTICPVGVLINRVIIKNCILLVGATGFELATPASRRQCSTRLSYAPIFLRVSVKTRSEL